VAILSNFGSEVQRNCTRSSQMARKQRRFGSKNQPFVVAYSRRVLDPGPAAFLLAFAFAGLLALPGLRKTARRAEQRFCDTCGRLKILGERTCDCD
jgi:hypothetical protein